MKIVFFGSDDFAVTHLKQLAKSNHKVLLCVTQPDARQGRGMKLVFSPVKLAAVELDLPYIQPATLNEQELLARLRDLKADAFVVVAYGKLLKQDLLDMPRLFCVNVHGSLLPKYRGAAPINWAVLKGDVQTGVTVQKMALELDAGEIIAQEAINIPPDMTADVLRRTMADVGAQLLPYVLNKIEAGRFTLTPQEQALVTYAPKLTKDMARIRWFEPAANIYNQIRGLKPWPGTHTTHDGKVLKILRAEALASDHAAKPGVVISTDKQGFTVACGKGALYIKEVQPEAGKPMPAASYTAGHKIAPGVQFA